MFKSKVKLITIAFILFFISLFFVKNNVAKASFSKFTNNNDDKKWNIVITSDTKDLEDTKEIVFKVEENPNVVEGKIAPGLKASGIVQIDLTKTKVPVDIKAEVDKYNLPTCFKLSAKLNEEDYQLGTIKTIELNNNMEFTNENGKILLKIEIEWVNDSFNNNLDTGIGNSINEINMPITIKVMQHI